jgi:hypothetical protein
VNYEGFFIVNINLWVSLIGGLGLAKIHPTTHRQVTQAVDILMVARCKEVQALLIRPLQSYKR